MLKRILVPLDEPGHSESHLPHALAVAKAFDAKVLLLQVLDLPQGYRHRMTDPVELSFRRAEALGYLIRLTERIRGHGVEVRHEFTEGDAATRIVQTADRWNADMVVLSLPAGEGRRCLPSGSIAAEVVDRVGRSVFLVPADEAESATPEPFNYKKILVPLDCSNRSVAALRFAASLARGTDTELVLTHVVPVPEMPHPAIPLDAQDLVLRDRVVARNRRVAQKYLAGFAGFTHSSDLVTRTRMEYASHIATTLHRLVAEESPDLVLMNAHGFGNDDFPDWPYGSVSGHLLTHGQVPRLIIQDAGSPPVSSGVREDVGYRPMSRTWRG